MSELNTRHLVIYRLTDVTRGESWDFQHYLNIQIGDLVSPSYTGPYTPSGLTIWSGVPFTYSLPTIEPGTFDKVIAEVTFHNNLSVGGLTSNLPFSSFADYDITTQAY